MSDNTAIVLGLLILVLAFYVPFCIMAGTDTSDEVLRAKVIKDPVAVLTVVLAKYPEYGDKTILEIMKELKQKEQEKK